MLESGRNRAVGHEALLFVNPSHNMTSKGDMKDLKISLSAQKKDLSVKRKGITLQYLCKKFRNSVSAMTWGFDRGLCYYHLGTDSEWLTPGIEDPIKVSSYNKSIACTVYY
ncbi:LOW QUALITY PROTEIN: hypothetical protein FGSG_13995 [Fusarium graminearum PH-1]|uniref:hypothetical protein n=1 Tax=Gibberella zeae (strain ATCC MYA-4620 / CBS 123657 / FGSC 9075 / NRRL 31084 / PH-1) TaxID=229533 RepID=UPI00021F20C7|nr:LOW QUALITY PROTEIN: hypothetical protein FGSG_13995 [Fusarium graminearum PH-1]ESU18350.1 LOW QUALITY PROTEIN: hypothetical protein FGSG_13995 [Fusarium graminearum PH-1]|eukprot:XP_011325972.1 LOW QUALITY PROTEIN: hypothetical protein FGSG_13995 [Fusarium graminearum PH-1]